MTYIKSLLDSIVPIGTLNKYNNIIAENFANLNAFLMSLYFWDNFFDYT